MGTILSLPYTWMTSNHMINNIHDIVLSDNKENNLTECPAGDFDYYLLSMSYAPDFCKLNPGKSHDEECDGNYNLVLHGLWPQYDKPRIINGKKYNYPEFCSVPQKWILDKEKLEQLLSEIKGWQDIAPEYRDLILHEWVRHGSCSGLDAKSYFDLAFKLAEHVPNPNIPDNATKSDLQKLFPTGYVLFDKDNNFSGVVYRFSKTGEPINIDF